MLQSYQSINESNAFHKLPLTRERLANLEKSGGGKLLSLENQLRDTIAIAQLGEYEFREWKYNSATALQL